jgi:catechol-2,3-dioxygenase
MPVEAFDHYNLRAQQPLLDELLAFYCDVIGLTLGERPPFRRFGYWLYAGGRPVLHLAEGDPGETCETDTAGTFNHASFGCSGRAQFEAHLAARGIEWRTARVQLIGQIQLFVRDPAGNGVELNFAADELAVDELAAAEAEPQR